MKSAGRKKGGVLLQSRPVITEIEGEVLQVPRQNLAVATGE